MDWQRGMVGIFFMPLRFGDIHPQDNVLIFTIFLASTINCGGSESPLSLKQILRRHIIAEINLKIYRDMEIGSLVLSIGTKG